MRMDILAAATRLPLWFAAGCAALFLAGCGGGGDDGPGRSLAPGGPSVQGTWVLTVSIGSTTHAPVDVAATDVPSEDDVANLSAAAVAELTGTTVFQGYTVTVTGNSIHVTDPNTDYRLRINSLATANYRGCGDCRVGDEVTFDISVNFTESGLLDGTSVPLNTDTLVMHLRYRRTG